MNIFQEVKERLTMKDVVELYGFTVNRSGFCSCPFHNEKTPSMKIYDKGVKCFGCGEGGDFTLSDHPALLFEPPSACNKLFRRSLFLESGVNVAVQDGTGLQAGNHLAANPEPLAHIAPETGDALPAHHGKAVAAGQF